MIRATISSKYRCFDVASGPAVVVDDLVEFGIKALHAEVVDDPRHEIGAVLVNHVINSIRFSIRIQEAQKLVDGHLQAGGA